MLGELHKGPQAQKIMQNNHNHGNRGGWSNTKGAPKDFGFLRGILKPSNGALIEGKKAYTLESERRDGSGNKDVPPLKEEEGGVFACVCEGGNKINGRQRE